MKYLPSIFTLLNLFCGYYALYSAYEGDFQAGAFAIFLAIFFDILDGRLARFSAQVTKFGKELDSLADMVSFGVSPAFLIYQFSLSAFGKQGVPCLFSLYSLHSS
ncbi:MAG: CDP-alcohol phosphatidyltransferase family protein [Thermodesulfobacterium sp.]|nr:CDP-alcohol phosphatidyltransferase family protein [Thermodesulfobacterium sp.]